MKHSIGKILFSIFFIFATFSCSTSKITTVNLYDPKEVMLLSNKLGIELSNVNKQDDKNMPLYAEASLWLGVPYKYSGMSKKGTDCSGLAYQIYRNVYDKKIPRSTSGLEKMKKQKIAKKGLRTGDLIFFASTPNKKKTTHVGIYLKDKYFIHSSSSQGVIVSHLDEEYYKRRWREGARIE